MSEGQGQERVGVAEGSLPPREVALAWREVAQEPSR